MNTTSVNKFRNNLKSFVEQVVEQLMPLKVTRRRGYDFGSSGICVELDKTANDNDNTPLNPLSRGE